MVHVTVSEGILEGEVLESSVGGNYYSFKGIPYAEPPLGDLRFRAPQKPKSWNGIRLAKEHGPVCYQYNNFARTIVEGSEDCLYLNVYTPDINPKNKLPVMFWIHGGSYMSGSGNSSFYGPDFLIKQGVIVVTINYRLEVLGFLCLDTKEIPGNAGMKDQVAALRWVNKNIEKFGGDPYNVTIFGESAGGGAVSYHLMSPMSKGLFRRAIVQSGSSNCGWTRAFEPRQRGLALAKQLGFKSENDLELSNFFKTVTVDKLVKKKVPIVMAEELQPNIHLHFNVVDEKVFGQERFFYRDLFNQLQNAIHENIEIMTGYTSDEGYLTFVKSPLDEIIIKFNKYLEAFVPMCFVLNNPISQQLEIGKKIKEFYYGKDEITKTHLEPLVKYCSFSTFIFDILQWVKFCAIRNKNVIYLYKFACVSERNVMAGVLGARDDILGRPVVCHADDLMYLFDVKDANVPLDKTSKSYKMIENVTTLWTNFAKYGNPAPKGTSICEWKPFNLENKNYLYIGDDLKPSLSPDKEEIEFWESIFKQYLPRNLAISF